MEKALKTMYNGIDEVLLKLPHEEKISLLREAFNENIEVFIDTSRIFLDNPVDKGGLATELVDQIFREEMEGLSKSGKKNIDIKFNNN